MIIKHLRKQAKRVISGGRKVRPTTRLQEAVDGLSSPDSSLNMSVKYLT